MGDDLELEVVSIERIDDMLDGFAWAQVSLGLGDPANGPCPEVVMRVPIRYEAGDTIDAVRARIWREGVRVVCAVAKRLDADMPPPVQGGSPAREASYRRAADQSAEPFGRL